MQNITNGTYKGQVNANGEAHGWGVCTYANGKVYQGEMRNGKAHGWVVFTYPNGDVYEGEMRNGEVHGVGIWKSAGNIYGVQSENGIGNTTMVAAHSNNLSVTERFYNSQGLSQGQNNLSVTECLYSSQGLSQGQCQGQCQNAHNRGNKMNNQNSRTMQ